MTNLSIAQAATLRPISEIAEVAGIDAADYEPLGRSKAKLSTTGVERFRTRSSNGKLVLVTAITPTPSGEGKTTVTVGLSQGLRRIGKTAIPAIREPALGPVLGNKGGACGGGYSQVLPMEDINLFFTGDFPAISAAHNLLSAILDARLHHGNDLHFDPRFPTWPRTMDMNDRALREIVVGLGGTANGYAREDGFVVTPASEVMAILCLSRTLQELKERLGRCLVGVTIKREPVFARDLNAHHAMTALLRDAIRPNLVQTIEGGPALVHGGPFANIAHGCSTIIGTECGLGLAEYTITEAGFASDLGAEKFLNIVCPLLGRGPNAIVLVATIRALKHHGGGDLEVGFANLQRHIRHLTQYGPPVVVAINRFVDDTPEETELVRAWCEREGVRAVPSDPWNSGGPGCEELAAAVAEAASRPSTFESLYNDAMTFEDRLQTVVTRVYGGAGFELSETARKRLEWTEKHGFGKLPICMAKTPASFSDDPSRFGAPEGFTIHIRELRTSIGAGFIVPVSGEILLMPGLGKAPAAFQIDVDAAGRITGLF
ncbi:MAG TPA: formate--tetrahydrofolate ligase [Fimbriimonadaceae bacterium]|nr:formate--tetrahydrofolate ligase [Fimbriimonadaceae bacterium]